MEKLLNRLIFPPKGVRFQTLQVWELSTQVCLSTPEDVCPPQSEQLCAAKERWGVACLYTGILSTISSILWGTCTTSVHATACLQTAASVLLTDNDWIGWLYSPELHPSSTASHLNKPEYKMLPPRFGSSYTTVFTGNKQHARQQKLKFCT